VPSELPDSTSAANLYWFALQGHAYWFSSTGDLKHFPVPYRDGGTDFLSREQSPDGNIWFIHGQNIGRMTLSGQADEFAVPGGYAGIGQPVVGSDGNLWTILTYTGAPTVLARITPDGTYTIYSPPGGPGSLTLYPGTDGSILASDLHGVIYRLDPSSNSGQFVVYHLPGGSGPFVGAPGGVIWFIQVDAADTHHLGRLDPSATPDGSGTLVTTTQGSSFSVTLTDVFLADPANSSASIDWGDGNMTNGTLVAGGLGGGFAVVGSNTYTSAGTYSIAVTIHSAQGAPITFYAAAQVAVSPNAHFLNRVYQELLNRSADPTGMAGWLAAMNQGMTRSEVVAQIEASTEYRRDVVASYYHTYLGRSSSDAELNPWVAFLASGASEELVKIGFLCSPEYAMRAGNTAVGILQAVYRDVLGRAVDPAGTAAWLTLVGHTITRPLAVDLILRSAEASQDLVQDYYTRYLGRQADVGGLTSWSTMLQNGGREETVQAGILGSTEFFSEP
jgi:hypothetical protein